MTSTLAIAVDGPVASGKSTVGRRLADELGFLFFDTGVIYRALAVAALDEGVPVDDGPALAALSRRRPIEVVERPATALGYAVLVGGEDVTARLTAPRVDAAASAVSASAVVRDALLEAQRSVARGRSVVMVGRDVGTVVLPDADVKIYLDASAEARARRRFRERIGRGEIVEYAQVLSALLERDLRDSTRAAAPLRAASDAIVVDTESLAVDEVVARLRAIASAAAAAALGAVLG